MSAIQSNKKKTSYLVRPDVINDNGVLDKNLADRAERIVREYKEYLNKK